MRQWTPNSKYGSHAFGIVWDAKKKIGSFQMFYDARERLLPWIKEYSPYELVTPGDMSLRLGCTPAVNDPVMMDVQKQIAAACRKHGIAWGRPVGSAADAKTIIDLGAQFVVHGSEFGAVHAHFTQCTADFDSILGEVAGAPAIPEGKTY